MIAILWILNPVPHQQLLKCPSRDLCAHYTPGIGDREMHERVPSPWGTQSRVERCFFFLFKKFAQPAGICQPWSGSASFPVVPGWHGLALVSSRQMDLPQEPLCALGMLPPQHPRDSPSFFRGLPGAPGREVGYREIFQTFRCVAAEIEKVKFTHSSGSNCRAVIESKMEPWGTGTL